MMRIKKWLTEPAVRNHNVDGLDFSMAHRQVLQHKAILRQLFENFYHECRSMDLHYFANCPGARLEIGSGAGIIREVYSDVITSDIKLLPFIDVVLSAEKLPFPDNSLRAIYAINVFHHLSRPREFFKEILRVLYPGGGVIVIEPFYGPMARWIFKNLHESEGFEPDAPGWEVSASAGPFSNANQALSYIVFKRDRMRFNNEFPELELVLDRPHTHLWYLVSGGVNFRQLVPNSFTSLVKLSEKVLAPFNRWLALQHTIVLRKKDISSSAPQNG